MDEMDEMDDDKIKKRKVWEGEIRCPHCEKDMNVRIEDKILVPAEKAEKETNVIVSKSQQKKVDEKY